jgi:hypothetical protein
MRRHLRQNLVLLVAALLLGGAAWLVVRREQAQYATPLTGIDISQVQKLSVQSGSTPPRLFERRGARWWMRQPYELPAHEAAVERLLGIAAAAPRTRRPASEFDPARIGLQPPQAVLELDGRRIEFGVTDALRGDRYVRQGDSIALVPDRFSAWLLAGAEAELDHRLAAPLGLLRSVHIGGHAQPQLAAAWNIVTTSQVAAVPAPSIEGGLPVELTDDSGATVRFSLTRSDDGRYIALREQPPLAYPLDEAQVQQLLPPAPQTEPP